MAASFHGSELCSEMSVFSKTNRPSRLILGVMQDMDVLHRNITEALRMHPPLIMVLRCGGEGMIYWVLCR